MRTKIAQDTSLRYERAKAVLDFKTAVPAPGISPFQVAFRFEAGAEFDSFAHFHADHDEFLYVEQGEVMLELNGVSTRVSPADGELRIPKWTPHRWYLPSGAAETVVWERTDPNDGQKEVFFRNLMGHINDSKAGPSILQVIVIFSLLDNYPLPSANAQSSMWLQASRALTKTGGLLAWSFGYRPSYPEYTPKHLLPAAHAKDL